VKGIGHARRVVGRREQAIDHLRTLRRLGVGEEYTSHFNWWNATGEVEPGAAQELGVVRRRAQGNILGRGAGLDQRVDACVQWFIGSGERWVQARCCDCKRNDHIRSLGHG